MEVIRIEHIDRTVFYYKLPNKDVVQLVRVRKTSNGPRVDAMYCGFSNIDAAAIDAAALGWVGPDDPVVIEITDETNEEFCTLLLRLKVGA